MIERVLRLSPEASNARLFRAGIILSVMAIILYFSCCIYYSLGTTFGGHGESSVVCTAWEFRQGRALYPATDAPERTAMFYGPMEPALLAGIFWLFGAHLAAVKAAGGIIAVLGFFACARVFRRVSDPAAALLALGWLALVYLKYTIFTYYLRPDSVLLLCLSLCLLSIFCVPRKIGWIIFALALAWGVNLKITMPVYVLPLLVWFWQRHGWGRLVLMLVGAAVLAVVPFLVFPQVSAGDYFSWLKVASAEGTERSMIVPVGGYLLLLSAPAFAVIAIFAIKRPQTFWRVARRQLWFGLVSVVSVLLVLRITGKPGAGPPHLLPLFPILGVVLAKSLREIFRSDDSADAPVRTPRKFPMLAIASAGFLALGVLLAFDIKGAVHDVFEAYPWSYGSAMAREINQIADEYPNQKMSMGPGSLQQSYPDLRYLPVLVLRGNPYILCIPSLMDMQKVGLKIPESTRRYMVTGTCPLWLIPRGEAPFGLRNWYEPRAPIFDEGFRQSFLGHYHIINHTKHFDVWQYEVQMPTSARKAAAKTVG